MNQTFITITLLNDMNYHILLLQNHAQIATEVDLIQIPTQAQHPKPLPTLYTTNPVQSTLPSLTNFLTLNRPRNPKVELNMYRPTCHSPILNDSPQNTTYSQVNSITLSTFFLNQNTSKAIGDKVLPSK